MPSEQHKPIHPDDIKSEKRRDLLKKGLAAGVVGGITAPFISLGITGYGAIRGVIAVEELKKTHPVPPQEVLKQATTLITEHNIHPDLPEEKVLWAQEQLAKKKAHDEEFARRFPDGVGLTKKEATVYKYIGIGGIGAAFMSLTGLAVIGTKEELSRRDLLRRMGGQQDPGTNKK
jgi:hypothetical protein